MDQNVSVCARMLQDQPACRNVFVQSSRHLGKNVKPVRVMITSPTTFLFF